jgi:hypothetical protein
MNGCPEGAFASIRFDRPRFFGGLSESRASACRLILTGFFNLKKG